MLVLQAFKMQESQGHRRFYPNFNGAWEARKMCNKVRTQTLWSNGDEEDKMANPESMSVEEVFHSWVQLTLKTCNASKQQGCRVKATHKCFGAYITKCWTWWTWELQDLIFAVLGLDLFWFYSYLLCSHLHNCMQEAVHFSTSEMGHSKEFAFIPRDLKLGVLSILELLPLETFVDRVNAFHIMR